MSDDFSSHVHEIQAIGAVPRVLETVAALTGMGFVCIAHVTSTSWTACAVHDRIGFGIKAGDGLDVDNTICREVHDTRQAVIIDGVDTDAQYRDHRVPRLFGFQSYFAIPLFRPDGPYFGTLCGVDPAPRPLSEGATVQALSLFAELVSSQLDSQRSLRETRSALLSERETAELREQFIAVLGHDLRTPLNAILNRVELLARRHEEPSTRQSLDRIRASALRMAALVDNVVDFTRGRMGSGLALDLCRHDDVSQALEQVVDELRSTHPEREIAASIAPGMTLRCDLQRLAQLLSNLLKNALLHGDRLQPVSVAARIGADGFMLEVANGGPDLGAGVIAQLFKPYWRAVSSAGADGLGLGLYIVDQIARGHGGTIDVTSGGGRTAFTFAMPAA